MSEQTVAKKPTILITSVKLESDPIKVSGPEVERGGGAVSKDRDKLSEILRAQGYDVRGDLVIVRPKYSETQGVRQSEVDVEMSTDVGITFAADGVNLDRFYKNPVVLWAHDYDGLPVGRADSSSTLSVECETPTLSAKLIFHLDTELSRETWSLVANGEEIKLELGVVPTEWDFAAGGVHVTKWDVVEISAVPSEECIVRIRQRIINRMISSSAMLRSVEGMEPEPEPPVPGESAASETDGPYSWRTPRDSEDCIVSGPGLEVYVGMKADGVCRVDELNEAWRCGRESAAEGRAPTRPEAPEEDGPEADVIAAATRFEEADRQFMELDRNNPWFGHYREIVIDERIKAMKDICEAVVHLRDGSGGAVAALEKGGEE